MYRHKDMLWSMTGLITSYTGEMERVGCEAHAPQKVGLRVSEEP